MVSQTRHTAWQLPDTLQAAGWAAMKTLVVYFAAAKLAQVLSAPSGGLALFAPAAGIALLLLRRWGPWAALGIFAGCIAARLSVGAAAAQTLVLLPGGSVWPALMLLASATTLQAWLANRLFARYEAHLANGGLRSRAVLLLMLGMGPLCCLVGSIAAALVFGWLRTPFSASAAWPALLWWLSDSLSVLMLAPALFIARIRGNASAALRLGPENPSVLMLALAIPAWLLAASANVQQTRQESEQVAAQAELLGRDVQARVDAATQALRGLAALYLAGEDVSANEYVRFTAALQEGNSQLLHLLWLQHVTSAEREQFETRLSRELGRPSMITERGSAAGFVRAAVRRDYWPLLRATPGSDQWPAGFDLGSAPEVAASLKSAHGGQLSVATTAAGAQHDVARLFLPIGRPMRGAASTALKIAPLLQGSRNFDLQVNQGLSELRLFGADSALLAASGSAATEALRTAPGFVVNVPIQLGQEQWRLEVTTPWQALPFLYSLLWWLAQLTPQLVCIAIGVLLVAEAARNRALARLEEQRAALNEIPLHLHLPLAPSAPAAALTSSREVITRPFDALIEKGWEAGQFAPRFEPIIELATGHLRGVEALLRWPQVPKGVITPDIIDWAERMKVISELDQRMLLGSLEALSSWPLTRGSHFTVSVNVSATEMMQPHWADRVVRALNETGVAGRRLCLEITEGILVRPDAQTLNQLARLRSNGIKVALDDFGTGYSSIGYLRQLPVDRIKLDRIFTAGILTDPKARQIVASVISLGHSLNIEVVAEGVEDAATAEVLLQLGCPLSQGWLFSRAVSASRVGRWLSRGAALYPDHALEDSELDLEL